MHLRCLILVFFLSSLVAFGQYQDKGEELEKALSEARNELSKIELCSKLASFYQARNQSKSKYFVDYALDIIEKDGVERSIVGLTPELRGEIFLYDSWYHFFKTNYTSALASIKKAIQYFEVNDVRIMLGRSYTILGNIYYRQKIYNIAEQQYTKSLQLLGIYKEDLALTTLYLNYGGFLVNQKRYGEAWDMFNEALQIYKAIDYQGDYGLLYNNMGVCAGYMGDETKKIELYHQAVAQYEKHNNTTNIINVHLNLGIAYRRLKEFDLALRHTLLSIEKAKQVGILRSVPDAYTTLANIYGDLGLKSTLSTAKDSFYFLSIDAFHDSRIYSDSLTMIKNNDRVNELLVQYENERKEKEIGQLKYLAEVKELEFQRQDAELLANALAAEADKQRAEGLEREKLYAVLQLETQNSKLNEQEAITLRQKTEIELLHQTNQIKDIEQTKQTSQRRFLTIIVVFLCVLSVVLMMLYFEKQKRNAAMIRHQKEIEIHQKEIESKNQHLENINKFKNIFISNMSHEIRTPLNTVIGVSGLLAKTNLDNVQQEYVNSVEFASENLLALVNDILDFSKLETGKIDFNPVTFDLRDTLFKITAMFMTQANEKGIQLALEMEDTAPTYIVMDKNRLRQVLINLMSNAVKFTNQGKVVLYVVTVEKTGTDRALLKFGVRDTGVGIPTDQTEKVFEAFTQLNNYNYMNHNGTGLGLAICKQIIELQGGSIGVQSKVGEGSDFYFSLPVTVVEKMDTSTITNYESKSLPALNILVVEDNVLNQMLIKTLLIDLSANARIDIADNGQKAIDILNTQTYDLIFMDMKMPVMDGVTATSIIRSQLILTPIIALTANATQEEKEKCLQAGMNDFMVKPIDRNVLAGIVDKWVGMKW